MMRINGDYIWRLLVRACSFARRWMFFLLSGVVVYFLYAAYVFVSYGNIPWYKKDVLIYEYIKSQFADGYDVNIVQADLVGFGDKFYIAYGNRNFIKKAFSLPFDIDHAESLLGEINYPIIKIFHIKDVDIISAALSGFALFQPMSNLVELQLANSISYSPVPVVKGDVAEEAIVANYEKHFNYPSVFVLNKVSVEDFDSDSKDEVMCEFLIYAGGSGATKHSIIVEFVDGRLIVSSGYPDLLDPYYSRYYWALIRFSGVDNPEHRDLKEFYDVFAEDEVDADFNRELKQGEISDAIFEKQAKLLRESINSAPDVFYDLEQKQYYTLFPRHSDDYASFVKIRDDYVFAEAFYLVDSTAHWWPHYWRVLGNRYDDGRWLSDRNVNGDRFLGVWLDEKRKYTLNEVFGTYPDQGVAGIAFSFLNSDWTATSQAGKSDPLGFEMRIVSPVEKKIREIYSYCN